MGGRGAQSGQKACLCVGACVCVCVRVCACVRERQRLAGLDLTDGQQKEQTGTESRRPGRWVGPFLQEQNNPVVIWMKQIIEAMAERARTGRALSDDSGCLIMRNGIDPPTTLTRHAEVTSHVPRPR